MTNETTASQPKSIGDNARFLELLREYNHISKMIRGHAKREWAAFVAYIDSRASAALASATIQAAPDLTKDVIEAVQWVTGTPDVDGIPQPYAGAIVLLETFAEIGMTAKRDGKPTPNSLLCTKFANDLRLAAASQEPVMVEEPVMVSLGDTWADSCKVCQQRADFGIATQKGPDGCREAVESGETYCSVHINGTLKTSAAPMVADPAGVEEWREVMQELVDLIDDAYEGNYEIDSFTAQPARILLAKVSEAATVKAVPSEALDAFAYFVQPSGFGPFIECSAQQPGSFVAYRAVKIAAPLADKTGGATFTENQLANACAELGVPDSTYESMCLLIKGGAV